MYRSTSFAAQKSKSVFQETSERSARTARVLQQAREARPERAQKEGRSPRRRGASLWNRLLGRLRGGAPQLPSEAQG